jgi:hypothetical protein
MRTLLGILVVLLAVVGALWWGLQADNSHTDSPEAGVEVKGVNVALPSQAESTPDEVGQRSVVPAPGVLGDASFDIERVEVQPEKSGEKQASTITSLGPVPDATVAHLAYVSTRRIAFVKTKLADAAGLADCSLASKKRLSRIETELYGEVAILDKLRQGEYATIPEGRSLTHQPAPFRQVSYSGYHVNGRRVNVVIRIASVDSQALEESLAELHAVRFEIAQEAAAEFNILPYSVREQRVKAHDEARSLIDLQNGRLTIDRNRMMLQIQRFR